MSIQVMTWAFTLPLPPSLKITLLAVADNASDDGVGWPRQEVLAVKTTQSRVTVGRKLKELESLGILKRHQRFRPDGSQTSDEIRINLSLTPGDVAQLLDAGIALQGRDRGAQSEEGGYQVDTPGYHSSEGSGVSLLIPPNEPSIEPSGRWDENPRARGRCDFTEGSKALASAFWNALGFDSPLKIPPEFAGVDWRAIQWERAGWTVDLIEAEARRLARDRPLKPLLYFEKVFATSFAKRQAPLPLVDIGPAESLKVTRHDGRSRGGNIIQAADRLVDAINRFDEGPRGAEELCGGAGAPAVRLLSQG